MVFIFTPIEYLNPSYLHIHLKIIILLINSPIIVKIPKYPNHSPVLYSFFFPFHLFILDHKSLRELLFFKTHLIIEEDSKYVYN